MHPLPPLSRPACTVLALLLLAACGSDTTADGAASGAADTGDGAADTGALTDVSAADGQGTPDIPIGSGDAAEMPDVNVSSGDGLDGNVGGADVPADGASPDSSASQLCVPSVSVCETFALQKVCSPDGASWSEVPCSEGSVCLNGACGPPACTPGHVICDGAQRTVCDDIGSGYLALPCPPGFGCRDATCKRIRANIVFVVDTSGSMDFVATSAPGSGACGNTPCPGFPFPICEDPTAPITRLGVTKGALQQLFNSKVGDGARLALQRFPQRGSSFGTCGSGYYYDVGDITCDNESKHELSAACLDAALGEFMVVPIDAATGLTDPESLLSWVDFDEQVTPTGQSCTFDNQCSSWICLNGQCATHTEPELRPTGATPLGKALYYAGEYLRLRILLEGKPCAGDGDCASSPDHRCEAGKCHDPFHACRKNVVVLFTDGEETVHDSLDDYWNPWVQAKRLHYGLGCTANIQCASGSTCLGGRCTPAQDDAPTGRCAASFDSCSQNDQCPDYYCGSSNPCAGHCTQPDVDFTDPLAKNYLKGWDGLPLPLTVHVADASGGTVVDNAMIAAWGGGTHVLVDFDDTNALFQSLYELVNVKGGNTCK